MPTSSNRRYTYRLVNVFVESTAATFGGNPLCVFENARGMSDAEMQSLAAQFNLSETT
ncbi:MAG TPA: PhzF family phenazine biosynthesis protein, partial [Casimicrobium sp.]|nr:PhzF family phenazine biosynthesis protein [Casimicrobium sp.]